MYKLFIFLLTGLFWSNMYAQDSVLIDRVVAVVGNGIIKQSDVDKMYFQMRSQGFGGGSDMKCVVYEDLLFQKLLLDQSKLDSLTVTDEQVEAEINNRISQFVEQIGSEKKLENYYGKKIFEIREMFRPVIEDQILTQQMQQKLVSEVEITPNEVRKFYKEQSQDSLPVINMQFEIAQVVVEPAISNQQKLKIKDKLEGFRKRILEGEDFAKFAVIYSEESMSAKKGGELGFMSRSELVPEFAVVAFKLEKGEVSRVVETEFGFHIMQLIEKRGEKVNVRHILLKPEYSADALDEAKRRVDSLYSVVKSDTVPFGKLAMRYSDDKLTKNNGGLYVNPYTGASKFDAKQVDPSVFYAIKDMKVGQVSKPIKAKDIKGKEVFKIIKLISKTDPHRANIDDDYQMIKEMALGDKKMKTLEEWSEKKKKDTYIKILYNPYGCPLKESGWVQ